MPAADRPDQRGVPFDQRVPGLLVAVPGAGQQIGDHGATAALLAGGIGAVWVRSHSLLLIMIQRRSCGFLVTRAGPQRIAGGYGRAIPVGAVRDGDAAATGLIGLSW